MFVVSCYSRSIKLSELQTEQVCTAHFAHVSHCLVEIENKTIIVTFLSACIRASVTLTTFIAGCLLHVDLLLCNTYEISATFLLNLGL